MRIALIAFHFAEYAWRLATALAEKHTVLLLLDRDNARRELGTGVPVAPATLRRIDIPNRGLKDPRMLMNGARIAAEVLRFKPDVVHVQEAPRDYLFAVQPLLRRYPLVLTIHDHVPHTGRDARERRRIVFYRDTLRRRADAAIVHGARIVEECRSVLPELNGRVFAVPHGVLGAARGAARAPEPATVLFFGRIEAYKGLGVLLDAVAILQCRDVNVCVLIAGTGSDLEAHRDRIAADARIELHERFIAPDEVNEFFQRAAVVVLPYTDATQSGVAAMAMHYGRPVVASDVGSIGEVVRHEHNGLLVPPRDAVALAGALERVVTERDLAQRLAARARATAQTELSWSGIATRTVDVYEAAQSHHRISRRISPHPGTSISARSDEAARRVRALFVVPSLARAGAETQLVDVVNGLDERGFDRHLLTFESNVDLLARLNRDAVHFHHARRRHRFDIAPARRIARIIDQENIDVVHCTLQIALWMGWWGVRASHRRPRLVVALHTTRNRDRKSDVFDRALYQWLLRDCATVVCVCAAQERHWIKRFPFLRGRTRVIHNGVDVARFDLAAARRTRAALRRDLNIPADATVLCHVGAFRPEKGHALMTQAFARIAAARNNVYVLFAGDGALRPRIEHDLARLGLSGRARFLGNVADVRTVYAASDIAVQPSTAETFSMALLEAMAMQLPVVATDVGGTREAVQHKNTGLLVPPGDATALFTALLRLLDDAGLRQRWGEAARARVSARFTRAAMIDHTQRVLSGWSVP